MRIALLIVLLLAALPVAAYRIVPPSSFELEVGDAWVPHLKTQRLENENNSETAPARTRCSGAAEVAERSLLHCAQDEEPEVPQAKGASSMAVASTEHVLLMVAGVLALCAVRRPPSPDR
jgi:hypothetical protein